MTVTKRRFQTTIRNYYRHHGRVMPWRCTHDPYRVLVSEIMLQQTQVARVMKFYPHFIKKFPDLRALAAVRTATLLRAWQGLGYNRRALALRDLAGVVLESYGGRLPRERAALESLPGIGKATAGAMRAFAWNEPEVFIETNVRRVFIHFFFKRRKKVTDDEVVRYIKRTLDRRNPREWYWALMDYGAMLGAAGERHGGGESEFVNPNRKSSHYKKQPKFSGSARETRGKILRILLTKKLKGGKISIGALSALAGIPRARMEESLEALKKEGFIKNKGNTISISQ